MLIFSVLYAIGVFVFPNKQLPTMPAQLGYLMVGMLGVFTAGVLKKLSKRITALEEKLQEKD